MEMEQKTATKTSYADICTTMLTNCPQLIFPVLNETFETEYVGEEQIERTDSGWKITREEADCEGPPVLCGGSSTDFYRIGFEMASDGTFIVSIAGSGVHEDTQTYLYLWRNSRAGKAIRLQPETAQREDCEIVIMQAQDYGTEDIFSRELYFLIPFHIFRYEKLLSKMVRERAALLRLMAEFRQIRERLDKAVQLGMMDAFTKWTVLEMTRLVIGNMNEKFQTVKEGVLEAMGGKVLETEASSILKKGIAMGDANRCASIVKHMYGCGKSAEEIANLTGIDRMDVEEMKGVLGEQEKSENAEINESSVPALLAGKD